MLATFTKENMDRTIIDGKKNIFVDKVYQAQFQARNDHALYVRRVKKFK